MERASSDFRRIIDGSNLKPKTFILSLENAISDKAFNYYMDEGNVGRVFYLLDGKRSPIKPIWKDEFSKKVNKQSLQEFVEYINEI